VGNRCANHVTPLYPQKSALTSPTGGGRSDGMVRSRTKATEFSLVFILLNILLSKISTACSSFFVNVHASAPHNTTGLISVLYNIALVALDKRQLLKRLIAAK